jgi:hypothetical protein
VFPRAVEGAVPCSWLASILLWGGIVVFAKLQALLLIVLILLPFSAPFPTYDVSSVVQTGHGRSSVSTVVAAFVNASATTAQAAAASGPTHVLPVVRAAGRVRLLGLAVRQASVFRVTASCALVKGAPAAPALSSQHAAPTILRI